MKRYIRSALSIILLLGALIVNLAPAQAVEPRFAVVTDLVASLSVSSSGKASCSGAVYVDEGYTVDLKMELKQDGTTIKTWTNSGSGMVRVSGNYYVTSGHNYMVVTTATAYTSSGQWVESQVKNSDEKHY